MIHFDLPVPVVAEPTDGASCLENGEARETTKLTHTGASVSASDSRGGQILNKERLFFENIRETLAALRPLWKKKK